MNFLANVWTAEWVFNLAVHLFLISALGWMFFFLFRHRPAPLRSGISLSAILALILLVPLSFAATGLHFNSFHTLFPIHLEAVPAPPAGQAGIDAYGENNSGAAGTAQLFSQKQRRIFPFQDAGPMMVQAVNFFGIIWGAGLIILLFRFAAGILSVRKLKKESHEVKNPRILRILREAGQSFPGWNKTPVYSSPHIPYPMVSGIFKPFILIPEHVVSKLPDHHIQGILLHELSHIHHLDPLSGMLHRLVKTINWWNPFAYALSRGHARAREEIADNYVLLLHDSKEYAECLINLADKTLYFKHAAASTGMGSCHIPLRDRIKHILSKERTMETRIKKRDFAAIIMAAMLLLAATAGTRFMFSLDGPSLKLIKKADPVYPEEARQAGIEGTVAIAVQTDTGGNVNQIKILKGAHDLLNKAAVEAVIQWKCEPMIIEGTPYGAEFTASFRFSIEDEKPGVETTIGAAVSEGPGIGVEGGVEGGVVGGVIGGVIGGVEGGVIGGVVGEREAPVKVTGDIKPPKLIKMVHPEYPEEARREEVEGVVILEAVTDRYGRVQEAKVLKSIPEFDQAAVDAVRQWVYEPVMIDGEPRGAVFTVTVSFKLK
jgi:TonB family protein